MGGVDGKEGRKGPVREAGQEPSRSSVTGDHSKENAGRKGNRNSEREAAVDVR